MDRTVDILMEIDHHLSPRSEAWNIGVEAYIESERLLTGDKSGDFKIIKGSLEQFALEVRFEELQLHELGSIYGGFRRINNFINSEILFEFIKEVRSFVFSKCIKDGKATNVFVGREIDFSILLACVPFGLFEPEDLILVETVKELESKLDKASNFEKLIVANYNIVRGHLQKVKSILDTLSHEKESNEEVFIEEKLFKLINEQYCDSLGNGEVFVLHKPYGNNNPYNPLPYERFPKIITNEDLITINGRKWPEDKDYELFLKVSVNKEEKLIKSSNRLLKGSEYTWEIGPYNYGDEVSYNFVMVKKGMEVYKSDNYDFFVNYKDEFKVKNAFIIERDSKEVEEVFITFESSHKTQIVMSIKSQNLNGLSFVLNENMDRSLFRNELKPLDLPTRESEKQSYSSLEFANSAKVIIHNNGDIECIMNGIHQKIISVIGIYSERSGICQFQLVMDMDNSEAFYGFGERYNSLNQAGEVIDNYLFNQYKDQGIKTYIPMPYYISSKGVSFFLETSLNSFFDMGSIKDQITITLNNSSLKAHMHFGSPRELIRSFTDLTGKPEMIPKWALGPWMSSNNWDNQGEVLTQMKTTLEYDIPATVLVIEAWSDEVTYYIFNDALYDAHKGNEYLGYEDYIYPTWGRWPNPKKMVDTLHNNNLKCILWQIPVLKKLNSILHLQNSNDQRFAIENDYVVKNRDKSPYQIPEDWFKDSYVLDFTNEEAKQWWFNNRRYLTEELKVDGFKTDGGECIFGRDLIFHDGRFGDEMRNEYSNLYVDAYYKFLNYKEEGRKNIPNQGLTFSRSGYTGAQKAPAHWAGDERSTFSAFKRSLLAGLSAGLSGITFWGWDFAGFSGDVPTDELYVRSAAMACFCPIMQYHAESKGEFNQDRTPWNIADRSGNPEVIDIYRYFSKLRMNLIPYIYREAEYSSNTGEPLMRALIIDYKNDLRFRNCFDAYMFGRGLFVAPIIEKDTTKRDVELPIGGWYDFFTGDKIIGGSRIVCERGWKEIAVYIKEASIIPIALNEQLCFGMYTGNNLDEYTASAFICMGDNVEDVVDIEGKGSLKIIKNNTNVTIEFDRTFDTDLYLFAQEKELVINGIKSESIKEHKRYQIHELQVKE